MGVKQELHDFIFDHIIDLLLGKEHSHQITDLAKSTALYHLLFKSYSLTPNLFGTGPLAIKQGDDRDEHK
jgi:hypothetical protein